MNVQNNSSEDIDNSQISSILQKKIRDQAKRLCSLQEYINLLENRIRQYNPNENFPITKNKLSNVQSFSDISEKYEQLQKKYNSLYETYALNNKSLNNYQSGNFNIEEEEFPDVNDIDPEQIFSYYSQIKNQNKQLIQEKNKLLSQLKKEIVTNDEQRNYIEILKQTIESSLIKTGLKSKIELIKKKYYGNLPEDDFATVILDIGQMKEKNDELMKLKEENEKQILKMNAQLQNFEETKENYNNLKEELEKLQEDKIKLDEEFMKLSTDYQTKENELEIQKNRNNEIEKHNQILLNENKEIPKLKKDNCYLSQTVNDLNHKVTKLSYDNDYLKDYQEQYENITRENLNIKQINQGLTQDNNFYLQQNDNLKNNLQNLQCVEVDNDKLRCELQNINDRYMLLCNEKVKNENYYMCQIQALQNEKNVLERMIANNEGYQSEEMKNKINSYKYDNKKLYDNNKKLNDENLRFIAENKFFTNLICRILKFHINNLDVKNILCELLNLNEKNVLLSGEADKNQKFMEKTLSTNNLSFEQKEKIKEDLRYTQNQLNEINQKIDLLENELKRYEC
jgi:hypothetical protein